MNMSERIQNEIDKAIARGSSQETVDHMRLCKNIVDSDDEMCRWNPIGVAKRDGSEVYIKDNTGGIYKAWFDEKMNSWRSSETGWVCIPVYAMVRNIDIEKPRKTTEEHEPEGDPKPKGKNIEKPNKLSGKRRFIFRLLTIIGMVIMVCGIVYGVYRLMAIGFLVVAMGIPGQGSN